MARKNYWIVGVLVCVIAIFGAYAIFSGGNKGRVKIVASENNWDSQRLHIALAKMIVDHAYDGYELATSQASSTMNWNSLLTGDVDLDIESWTFNVPTYEDDKKRGDIVDVGVLVSDSAQGLYVPRYVIEGDKARGIKASAPGLKTVKDLARYYKVFPDDEKPKRGRIYGSLPGWMADEVLYKKFKAYGLDKNFEYVRLGDESTLFSSLASAYNRGLPWVGYCYEPTYITGKLDLVRLEDSPYNAKDFQDGKCEFPNQELKIVCSRKFPQKAPDLMEFFKRYKTGSTLISKALAHMADTGASIDSTAVWVLTENDNLIDEWLPKENAAKFREYLKTRGENS